jgi:hypothetical protein
MMLSSARRGRMVGDASDQVFDIQGSSDEESMMDGEIGPEGDDEDMGGDGTWETHETTMEDRPNIVGEKKRKVDQVEEDNGSGGGNVDTSNLTLLPSSYLIAGRDFDFPRDMLTEISSAIDSTETMVTTRTN